MLTVRTALPGAAAGFHRILAPSGFSTPPAAVLECARLVAERFGASLDQLQVPVDPARSIVRYARDNAFDLIVMGTHGRSGIAHLVKGSVAEEVIRGATCPVMTVHLAHEQAAEPLFERKAIDAST